MTMKYNNAIKNLTSNSEPGKSRKDMAVYKINDKEVRLEKWRQCWEREKEAIKAIGGVKGRTNYKELFGVKEMFCILTVAGFYVRTSVRNHWMCTLNKQSLLYVNFISLEFTFKSAVRGKVKEET